MKYFVDQFRQIAARSNLSYQNGEVTGDGLSQVTADVKSDLTTMIQKLMKDIKTHTENASDSEVSSLSQTQVKGEPIDHVTPDTPATHSETINDDVKNERKDSQQVEESKPDSAVTKSAESVLDTGAASTNDLSISETQQSPRKHKLEEDETEVISSSHKKSRIHFSDDEDEEDHAYLGQPDDVPSIYTKIPEIHFPMRELVDQVTKVLELYDDEYNKTTAKSFEEYWRKKCAVAYYPTTDLTDQLPGEIPSTDFSNAKPGNQISFTTFMTYVEGFFRQFNEDDLRWLNQTSIHSINLFSAVNPPLVSDGRVVGTGVQPYDPIKDPQFVPPLGAYYQDIWQAENEGKQVKISKLQLLNAARVRKQFATPLGDREVLKTLDEHKVSAGPMTSRLLSALVGSDDISRKDMGAEDDLASDANDPEDEDDYDTFEDAVSKGFFEKDNHNEDAVDGLDLMNFEQIEQRLKNELQYLGVFMNVRQKINLPTWDQDWGIYKEDDEVSSEIRSLQRQLKETQQRNNVRKQVLIPKVKEQIAWQEYIMILDDLDKQIEQYYRRRLGTIPKKGSKKREEDPNSGITSASFKALLDKRKRWIEKIGPLFGSNFDMRRMPREPIFQDAMEQLAKDQKEESEQAEQVDENDEDQEQQEEVNPDQL